MGYSKYLLLPLMLMAATSAIAQRRDLGMYWAGLPYDEYCSAEQKKIDSDFVMSKVESQLGVVGDNIKRWQAEIVTMKQNPASRDSLAAAKKRLDDDQNLAKRGREKEALFKKALQARRVVDCSKPDLTKKRPPPWAGATLPVNFVGANYRPVLPPDIKLPPTSFCTAADKAAAVKSFTGTRAYADAKERAQLRTALAQSHLKYLSGLAGVATGDLSNRVRTEMDAYSKITQQTQEYQRQIDNMAATISNAGLDPKACGTNKSGK